MQIPSKKNEANQRRVEMKTTEHSGETEGKRKRKKEKEKKEKSRNGRKRRKKGKEIRRNRVNHLLG